MIKPSPWTTFAPTAIRCRLCEYQAPHNRALPMAIVSWTGQSAACGIAQSNQAPADAARSLVMTVSKEGARSANARVPSDPARRAGLNCGRDSLSSCARLRRTLITRASTWRCVPSANHLAWAMDDVAPGGHGPRCACGWSAAFTSMPMRDGVEAVNSCPNRRARRFLGNTRSMVGVSDLSNGPIWMTDEVASLACGDPASLGPKLAAPAELKLLSRVIGLTNSFHRRGPEHARQ